jgi:hypothetical protein
MGYYDILLWGDDTEDERNAKIIAKRRDSKINELLGIKEPKIVEEKVVELDTSKILEIRKFLKSKLKLK